MSQTPFASTEGFRVGTVEFVSPNEIKVLLDIEAPDSVALNTGGVRPFPRVNGYVLIPVDDAFLVGIIGLDIKPPPSSPNPHEPFRMRF